MQKGFSGFCKHQDLDQTLHPRRLAVEPSFLSSTRALDKREYMMKFRDIFSYFSMKPYVVTPHLNCLVKTVQMRGHNICFNNQT